MARSRGIGRASGTATVAGVAVAIPDLAIQARIKFAGDGYAGVGAVASPVPAAATTNSANVFTGESQVWTLEGSGGVADLYLYLYAGSGTFAYTVDFYG